MNLSSTFRLILSALALLLAFPAARAGLFVYEPYDYPAGTTVPALAAAPGGVGLVNLASPDRVPLMVESDGLAYFSSDGRQLAVAGRAVTVKGGDSIIYRISQAALDGVENLRHPADSTAIGNPGTEVWFSYLFRVEGEADADSMDYLTLNLGTQIPIGLLHNQAGKQPFPIKVVSKSTDKSIEPGEAGLIVGHIVFSPGEGDGKVAARLEVWINPPIGGQDPGTPADAALHLPDAKLRGFWMSSKGPAAGVATFYELRFGTSFPDVVPSAP